MSNVTVPTTFVTFPDTGPYALACAASLPPEKLKAVSIVVGLGPPDIGVGGMNWFNALGFSIGWRLVPLFPRLFRWVWQAREPSSRLDLTDEKRLELLQLQISKAKLPEKDDVFFKDIDVLRLMLRSVRESFAQGWDGFVQDGTLVATDFGFRVEDIRPDLTVQLWYGKQDTFVPASHGEQIASRLGANAHLRVEDETHASLPQNWREKILEDLLQSI